MSDVVLSQGVPRCARSRSTCTSTTTSEARRSAGSETLHQDTEDWGHDQLLGVSGVGLPTWLPSAGMEQLRRHAADTAGNRRSVQAQVGPNAKRVIMAVVHGSAVPHVAHVDCRSWLHGPSRETRLIQWVACSDLRKFHDRFI